MNKRMLLAGFTVLVIAIAFTLEAGVSSITKDYSG